jgi:protein subunit release factor B
MNNKEKITILNANDLEISYYCGSGPGGTNRNRKSTGVQIIHKESGSIGRASDSRSQTDNKKNAFIRLTESTKFKVWLNKKLFEIKNQETAEEAVEKELAGSNVKYEIKKDGQWIEVPPEYFESDESKKDL